MIQFAKSDIFCRNMPLKFEFLFSFVCFWARFSQVHEKTPVILVTSGPSKVKEPLAKFDFLELKNVF